MADKNVKLAFYRGRGRRLFDRLVCWWMNGEFSHVELVLAYETDGPSHCLSSSPIDGGVRLGEIDLRSGNWELVDVAADQGRAMTWFSERMGKRYDWLGLLGFVWRPFRTDPNRYFCSEAVAAALGFPDPWRFDPNALHAALTREDA